MRPSLRRSVITAFLIASGSLQASAQDTAGGRSKADDVCGPKTNSADVPVRVVDFLTGAPVGYAQVVVVGLTCVATADSVGELTLHHVPLGPAHIKAAWIGMSPTDTLVTIVAGQRQHVVVKLRSKGPQPYTIEPLPSSDLRAVVVAALRYLVLLSSEATAHADTLHRIVDAPVDSVSEGPALLLDLTKGVEATWIAAGGDSVALADAGISGVCTTELSHCTHAGVVVLYAVEGVARLGPDSVYVRIRQTLWDQTICMGDQDIRAPLIVRHLAGWQAIGEADIGGVHFDLGTGVCH